MLRNDNGVLQCIRILAGRATPFDSASVRFFMPTGVLVLNQNLQTTMIYLNHLGLIERRTVLSFQVHLYCRQRGEGVVGRKNNFLKNALRGCPVILSTGQTKFSPPPPLSTMKFSKNRLSTNRSTLPLVLYKHLTP